MQVQNKNNSVLFNSYASGHFKAKHPDEVYLDPRLTPRHELEFWFTQLQKKMMGDDYFLITGFGLFKK